jgi:hypothetical protein
MEWQAALSGIDITVKAVSNSGLSGLHHSFCVYNLWNMFIRTSDPTLINMQCGVELYAWVMDSNWCL